MVSKNSSDLVCICFPHSCFTFKVVVLFLLGQSIEPLHSLLLPFGPHWLLFKVAAYLMFTRNPMSVSVSLVILVVWSLFSNSPHKKGSCEQCSLSSDMEIIICSYKVSFVGYKILGGLSFPPCLPPFLLSFLSFSLLSFSFLSFLMILNMFFF